MISSAIFAKFILLHKIYKKAYFTIQFYQQESFRDVLTMLQM